MIHHIHKIKGKKYMNSSMDAKKALGNIQHLLMIKTKPLSKMGVEERTYLNIIKVIYGKPTANIILKKEI